MTHRKPDDGGHLLPCRTAYSPPLRAQYNCDGGAALALREVELTANNTVTNGTSTKNPKIANRTCMEPHQNNTASGIITINTSRATKPSHPRNSIRSAFIVASGGVCSCSNQYPVHRREPVKSGEMECPGVQFIVSPTFTPGPPAASGLTKPQRIGPQQRACSRAWRNTGSPARTQFLPMEFSHSFGCLTDPRLLGGIDGDCSGIKCGGNHPLGGASSNRGSVGPASLPDTLISLPSAPVPPTIADVRGVSVSTPLTPRCLSPTRRRCVGTLIRSGDCGPRVTWAWSAAETLTYPHLSRRAAGEPASNPAQHGRLASAAAGASHSLQLPSAQAPARPTVLCDPVNDHRSSWLLVSLKSQLRCGNGAEVLQGSNPAPATKQTRVA